MGWACNAHGGNEKTNKILAGKPEGKRPLGRLDVDRRIILKCILGKMLDGSDWIHLTPYRDRWRAVANTVMNIRFP
jgi:hypothetical protein